VTLKQLLGAGLIGSALIMGACESSGTKQQYSKEAQAKNYQDRLRESLIGYMAQPKFRSSDFIEQITGTKARLEVYSQDDEMLYFSIPASHFDEKNTLNNLSSSPQNVEFGKLENNRLVLGNYIYSKPRHYFFRFPATDLRTDRSDGVRISFRNAQYNISIGELVDFAEYKSIYGGFLYFEAGKDAYGRTITYANHGAFVAKKGEPSLERLVSQLINDRQTKEEKAQKLLDFVTANIRYDGATLLDDVEILKKANEVLMTKIADCSGKVILYSSLLEQAEIEHRLIYFEDHISVAVEGNYANRNSLRFELGDKRFSIAETTNRGFRIGKTRLKLNLKDMEFLQKPGIDSKIIGAYTGEPARFI
jgi:hypothetical protein